MSGSLRSQVSIVVAQSESRARKFYAASATGVLQQYGVLFGFLDEVVKTVRSVRDLAQLHILFFPSETYQLFCAFKRIGLERFSAIEMRDTLSEHGRLVEQVVTQHKDSRHVYVHGGKQPRGGEVTNDGNLEAVISKLVVNVLGGRVADSFEVLSALAVPLTVPSGILKTNPPFKDLSGLLVLVEERKGRLESFQQDVSTQVRAAFDDYLEAIWRLASSAPDIFIYPDVSPSAHLARGIGHATYMLQHRFRNYRQVAEEIAEHYRAADMVRTHPREYEQSIQDLDVQLNKARWLEGILRHLVSEPFDFGPMPVVEVTERFESLFRKSVDAEGIPATLDVKSAPSISQLQITTPYRLLDEVFLIHLENALYEIKRPDTVHKQLELDVHPEGNYVCFEMTNYGPPVPADVLEDLDRVRQVRRPERTGLGVFLSALILQSVGGDLHFRSPVKGNIGTAVTLRFRKYVT